MKACISQWISVAVLTLLTRTAAAQLIDDLVHEEARKLDQVSGFPTSLAITDTGETVSHAQSGISVNRKRLQEILDKSQVNHFREMIRFILAHEKAHQVQFKNYPAGFFDSTSPDKPRLKEIQADIIAGKYLIETFAEATPDQQLAIKEGLKMAFDLGSLGEYSDYPSPNQRRTAARLGMALGNAVNLGKLVPTNVSIGSIQVIYVKVDYRPPETFLEWSLRLGKRITHYESEAYANLAFSNKDCKISWDKSAEHPYVDFEFVYQNTGQRTLAVDMEVQCAAVLRKDPDNTLEWLKQSVRNYRFKLAPGEFHEVKGTLLWGGAIPSFSPLPDLMPRLVIPVKDPRALVGCEFEQN